MNYNDEMPTTVTNTMRMPVKRALLVGINYIGNRAQLRGNFTRTYLSAYMYTSPCVSMYLSTYLFIDENIIDVLNVGIYTYDSVWMNILVR